MNHTDITLLSATIQTNKFYAISLAKVIPRASQPPMSFVKNMQYATMGWTPQAQDSRTFYNKHFVSSPSFINHNSWCSPCLWLWKPPPSRSWRSRKNTLATSFAQMFTRLHHHSKLTPLIHAPYHFENAQCLFPTTNISHISKPMSWCSYPFTLQPSDIATVLTMGQFICSIFLTLVLK